MYARLCRLVVVMAVWAPTMSLAASTGPSGEHVHQLPPVVSLERVIIPNQGDFDHISHISKNNEWKSPVLGDKLHLCTVCAKNASNNESLSISFWARHQPVSGGISMPHVIALPGNSDVLRCSTILTRAAWVTLEQPALAKDNVSFRFSCFRLDDPM